ncbi:hypothetical protein ABTY61_07330 [Kitasatospora sp. NPDC096128]
MIALGAAAHRNVGPVGGKNASPGEPTGDPAGRGIQLRVLSS